MYSKIKLQNSIHTPILAVTENKLTRVQFHITENRNYLILRDFNSNDRSTCIRHINRILLQPSGKKCLQTCDGDSRQYARSKALKSRSLIQ